MQTDGKDRFNSADTITLQSPLTPWEMRGVGAGLQMSHIFCIMLFLALVLSINRMINLTTASNDTLFLTTSLCCILRTHTQLIVFKKTKHHK